MTDQDHRHTAPKRPENPSGRNYADELSPLTDASIRDNATMLLTRETAAELLDAIDACMKTGERQTTRAVDVWRAAPDLPVFGVHVSIDGASWTCGAVRGWDVDGLADGLEALLA